jgi:hypothetical protein
MPKTGANGAMYNILFDVTGKGENEITLAHLSTFNFDNVKLNTVLPAAKVVGGTKVNENLYNILVDVTGKSANQIALSDLSSFDYNKIKLSTVMPKTESNKALYNVLFDVTGKGENEITLAHLSTFSFTSVRLSTVMPKTDANSALYDLLLDVINGDNGIKTADDITISDLSSFDYNNMHLTTIVKPSENASLFKVLLDVVNSGKEECEKLSNEDLKLSHLSSFDVTKIHLQTVLGEEPTGNVILDKLLEKNVEISNLGSALNGLSLYEIYGQNCFDTYDGTNGQARYKKDGNSYILDDDGNFVVSKSAGIWLFLCFESEGVVTEGTVTLGCATKYTVNTSATLATLSNSGSSISSKLTSATIRQLVDAGILDSALPQAYTKTLQQVANGNIFG